MRPKITSYDWVTCLVKMWPAIQAYFGEQGRERVSERILIKQAPSWIQTLKRLGERRNASEEFTNLRSRTPIRKTPALQASEDVF